LKVITAIIIIIIFYYRDMKQEIVHTLLLEDYGAVKKWVIIMDKRQDKTAALTQAETSGSSAQDRSTSWAPGAGCARGSGGGAKKRRGNGDE